MKKIIIALVVFIAGCYRVGYHPIEVYKLNYPTSKEIIASMDTLWNKYPEFRLNYKCLKKLSRIDGYIRNKYFRKDTSKYLIKGDSSEYFLNPKLAYFYEFEFLGNNNIYYNLQSADGNLIYSLKIARKSTNEEFEYEIWLLSAYRFDTDEIIYDRPEKENVLIRLQFEKEVVPKLEKILKEIRKKDKTS